MNCSGPARAAASARPSDAARGDRLGGAREPTLESFVSYSHLRPARAAEHPLHAPNAALLIDFDNVTLGIRSDLTKELRTLLNSEIIKGKVAVQRAYADWRRYPQYIAPLSSSSIDLIFAPAFGTTKKNATDIRLAIDAIELVFTRPEIGTFIIMSGDSDFSTMVIKLKEYGKYVIGVGIRESASDLLIQNCDEYFSYSDLAGLTKEPELPGAPRDPWELTREAVAQMARNGDVMRSDRLKQVMQQIDPNFDERTAGFSRFSKFVTEAGQKGLLQVSKLENGQYEVAPIDKVVGSAPAAPSPAESGEAREGARRGRGRRGRGGRDRAPAAAGESARPPERAESPERGARAERPESGPPLRAVRSDGSLSLARAFQLMSQALSELGGAVTHEALRLRMVALHGRDDALLEVARFQRLLRQANDAEIADVRKVGDDEYEVSAHRNDDPRARAGTPARPAPRAEASPPAVDGAGAAEPAAVEQHADSSPPPVRGANQRLGIRFRRGARAPSRAAGIPLVGVVTIDAPAAVSVTSMAALPEAAVAASNGKPAKARKPRVQKAAKPSAEKGGPAADSAVIEVKPKRRPSRPRAKKKAE